MSDEESRTEFPARDQRLAFCSERWEDHVSEAAVRLHESYGPGFAFTEAVVDRDTRTIRNVSLLGRTSRNGRTYSRRALGEAAELHEGAGVYIDHPTRTEERERDGVRSVRDLAGRVLRASAGKTRVRGDIQILEGAEGDKILAIAEHMPGVAGFSHRATGTVETGEDGDVVESISAVHGADIVTDPATVDGLFESLTHPGGEADMDLSTLDLATLRSERPDLIEAAVAETEEAATIAALKEANEKLRARNDELEVEMRAHEREELIARKLDEADLPDFVVTDLFREQLERAEDEDAIAALVEERVQLAKRSRSSGPRSTGRNGDALARGPDEGGYEDVDEHAMETADKILFG